jgi:phage terminase large subunit-like protein
MFSDLEDELCNWDPLIDTKSPNRLDALVWACTALVDPEMNATLSFGSLGRKR